MPSGRKRDEARRRLIASLRGQGWSMGQIADQLGVSRQAVHRVVHEDPLRKHILIRCRDCRKPILSPGALPRDDLDASCLRCALRDHSITFGQRLRAFRLAAGLTQTELAGRAGVDRVLIHCYESETCKPKRQNAIRLARVLGKGIFARSAESGQVAG